MFKQAKKSALPDGRTNARQHTIRTLLNRTLKGRHPILYSPARICDIRTLAMYAIRGRSQTYHLVYTQTGATVCGLKTRALRLKIKHRETSLHQTPTRPLDRIICKHCVRMAEPSSAPLAEQSTLDSWFPDPNTQLN